MSSTSVRVNIRSNHEFYSLLKDGLKKCRKGEIWHLALSFVRGRGDIPRLDFFVKRALVLLGEKPGLWDLEELVEHLQRIFDLPETELFFASNARDVMCERTMLAPEQYLGVKSVRPDRMVVFDDKIVIVDFKSEATVNSEIYNRYIAQVKGYITLAKKIFNLPAEGYLLFISEPRVDRV